MNTQPQLTTQALADYKSTMQAVAEGYLKRHWDEHLDEGQLFERTCQYLVANEVPLFMAQRLVYLAMSTLTPPRVTVGWDIANGSDQTVVVLVDSRDGIQHVINRRLLPQRFLAHTAAQ